MYTFDTKSDLTKFIASAIVDTSEAMELLGCSRQNIDDLVKREKLIPIRSLSKTKIFFKDDILERIKT